MALTNTLFIFLASRLGVFAASQGRTNLVGCRRECYRALVVGGLYPQTSQ